MRPNPGIWLGGVTSSALLHLGLAALLLWSLRPDTVDQQPSPQSELQLQAYRVPYSQAVPQPPQADPAAQSEASGEGVAAGAMPQSKAQSLPPPSSQVEQARPSSTVVTATQDPAPQAKPLAADASPLTPATPPSDQLTATTAPAALPIAEAALPVMLASLASQPTPVELTEAVFQPSTAATLVPAAQRLTTATPTSTPSRQHLPDTSPLSETQVAPNLATPLAATARPLATAKPNSMPSHEQAPDTTKLIEHSPAPVSAALFEPEVPHIKAALAFSGDGADQADPVSLAAFQSFMMPGDIAASGDPLRDGVAGILAAVPCSRLQVMFDPETATLNLRGHLPENGLRTPVLAALQAQMGADIQVSDQMKILPRPQCGALAGISNVGLPQSTDQITNPRLIGADTHARVLDYTGGERMFFDLTAPDYDAYVYVDYFDAGGAVLHLSPNNAVPLTLTPAQSRLRVGAKSEGDIGLQITVGPPYGQEITVAFAASHQLYPGLRPFSEEALSYLIWLSERVAEARASHPDFKGEWVYFFVSTAAQ